MTTIDERPMSSTRGLQLELLRRLQTYSPPPFLMGGFAEDALLHGGFSREHNDLDLLVERSGLGALLGRLASSDTTTGRPGARPRPVSPFTSPRRRTGSCSRSA